MRFHVDTHLTRRGNSALLWWEVKHLAASCSNLEPRFLKVEEGTLSLFVGNRLIGRHHSRIHCLGHARMLATLKRQSHPAHVELDISKCLTEVSTSLIRYSPASPYSSAAVDGQLENRAVCLAILDPIILFVPLQTKSLGLRC